MAVSFKEKIKTLTQLILEPKVLSALLSLRHSGYLLDKGWFNSFKSGKPVDAESKPIPWFSYPSIEFLESRLNKKMTVFEFGSGNSTLFFADKVNQIISVEHSKNWFDKISIHKPANSKIILAESESLNDYVDPLIISNLKYDIIIVDGLFRNECLYESMNHLTDSGVLILDDSERGEYDQGINKVINQGFKRIDFWGFSPGYLYKKSTGIFYQRNNCLNI